MPIRFRPLAPEDALAVHALRAESLLNAPLAFASAPEDDRLASLDFVSKELAGAGPATLFGADEGGALLGTVTLLASTRAKQAHKAYVVGMYVAPAARGRGVGMGLLSLLIQVARERGVRDLHLSVNDAAPAALRLYQRAGFQAWGREPRGVCWRGQWADTIHMVLHL